MLKTRIVLFSFVRALIDIVIVALCWIFVYYIRFHWGIFDVSKGIPDFCEHLNYTVPVVLLTFIGCVATGFYKPKRTKNLFELLSDMFRAAFVSWSLIIIFFYYVGNILYSRKLQLIFCFMILFALASDHILMMSILRFLRARGLNLKYYAVIGTGTKAQQLVRRIDESPWLGLKCSFFISNFSDSSFTNLLGRPIYNDIHSLSKLAKEYQLNEIYLALDDYDRTNVYPVLQNLQLEGYKIRILPQWVHLVYMGTPDITNIGSQILFSAADSPLQGYKVILKRIFDIIVSLTTLMILALPMVIIMIIIKLTSEGPVFYSQVRLKHNQQPFSILKFRTMYTDAEINGPGWTTKNDPRRTPFGKILRITSLDELPQLINVFKGDMSLVGPRPERPCYVKDFSGQYRKYLLRHNIKSGITGWAQIHGYRGDTSLKKRLIYDLYYIKNWSFAFDLWILLLTPFHLFRRENAY